MDREWDTFELRMKPLGAVTAAATVPSSSSPLAGSPSKAALLTDNPLHAHYKLHRLGAFGGWLVGWSGSFEFVWAWGGSA